jgi:hypothetical protein
MALVSVSVNGWLYGASMPTWVKPADTVRLDDVGGHQLRLCNFKVLVAQQS